MKRFILIVLACLTGFLIASAAWYFIKFKANNRPIRLKTYVDSRNIMLRNKIERRKDALLQFAKQNGYSTTTCFLVDMSIEPGKNRFFVYDLIKDSIVDAGLVAHGCCNNTWLIGRKYGNENGCDVLRWVGTKLESPTRAGLAGHINYMVLILPIAMHLIASWCYTLFTLYQNMKQTPTRSAKAMVVLWSLKDLCKGFSL